MRLRFTPLRILLAFSVLAAVALLVAWIERVSIANRFAEAEFDARKVDARYQITRVGPRTQRIEKLVIGDPRDPDLTAEWVEVDLAAGLGGVSARAIRARGVRLKGQLIDGKLSLGAVDRLLPAPSGEPFSLPDLLIDLRDAEMRLEMPEGRVGLALAGQGNLRDGFGGAVALVAPSLTRDGCRLNGVRASGAVSSADGEPRFAGPVTVAGATCPDLRLDSLRLVLDSRFGEALDSWKGSAQIAARAIAAPRAGAGGVGGSIAFDGNAAATKGSFDLAATALRVPSLSARDVGIEGSYEASFTEGLSVTSAGGLLARSLAPDRSLQARLKSLQGGAGTPVGPLVEALRRAFAGLERGSEARARYALAHDNGAGSIKLSALSATSVSGARLGVQGEAPVIVRWPGGVAFAGRALISGGGFPSIDAQLSGDGGVARIAPFASGGARLALEPVRFSFAPKGLALSTVATLDGPLGGGRVTGLRVPIALRPGQRLPQGCFPSGFRSLQVGGLRLAPANLSTCLTGANLRIAAPRLGGTLGQSPILLAASSASYSTSSGAFAADMLSVWLGSPERVSRFEIARLSGTTQRGGATGQFGGTSGQIGNVPILVSEASGGWRFINSVLELDGRLRAADAAPEPRYTPLVSEDFRLTIADGRIVAGGTARNPQTGIAIGNIDIRHALASGTGEAIIDVPGLAFGRALQPEQLTPITLGVIANVSGSVRGRGTVRWTPEGVTSSGGFRTEAMNFAAAFGPVTGLSGEIALSDLLGLESPSGQQVRIAAINPGILVTDGDVRYRLLPGQRVQIESGTWPFAGGTLRLQPTILDLGQQSERRLTFKVEGLDAARFITALEFENISATGIFDGELPMIFDASGGRIVGGRLVARDSGGTLSYVGQISNERLGTYGRIAFDALKAMKYTRLTIELDGALDGDVITKINFAGVNQAEIAGGRANLPIPVKIIGLNNIPFIFNVTITAKFRQLFEMARSFDDPSILINRALPQLEPLPRQTVKPPESGVPPQ